MNSNKKGFVLYPSTVPVRFSSASEKAMLEGFTAVATEIMRDPNSYTKNLHTLLAGIELELPLVNQDFTLAAQARRDAVMNAVPGTGVELAAHQIEVIPQAPADLRGDLLSLEKAMESAVAQVKVAAREQGLSWVRVGSYPLCHIREVDYTKGLPKYIKYERSPKWHEENQRPNAEKYLLTDAGPLDVHSGLIVGLLNAIQVTVDATSLDDAVDKVNRSYMISPMAVAMAASSSHLGYINTKYADARFVVWEISHDSRTHEEVRRGFPTRVGLPANYFNDLNEYFNQVLSYPFILNDPISMQHPFEVGNGLYWRDARIKFFRDQKKLGVEFRPVGIQPSLHEDVAIMLFYIGRLLWSQENREALLPMSYVRKNKDFAMSKGMQSKLYTSLKDGGIELLPANEALSIEIARAEEGLALLGADAKKRMHYTNIWRDRVILGSPAEVFNGALKGKPQSNFADARRNLIKVIEELGLQER